MIDKKLLPLFLVTTLLIACGDDDEIDDNSKPEKIGSYTLEITGPENYTLEGNAVMGAPRGDTLLAVGLEKRTSTPSGVSSAITFNISDTGGIYQSQELPIEAVLPATPYVQVVGAINDEPLVGLSGTVNISDGRKEDFLDATFSFSAKYGSGTDIDTVQGTGSFQAEDPNN
jgi:hypothetical protein